MACSTCAEHRRQIAQAFKAGQAKQIVSSTVKAAGALVAHAIGEDRGRTLVKRKRSK